MIRGDLVRLIVDSDIYGSLVIREIRDDFFILLEDMGVDQSEPSQVLHPATAKIFPVFYDEIESL
jgi:hypothetical protein